MNVIAKDQVGARLRTLANDVRVAGLAFEKARVAAEKAGLTVLAFDDKSNSVTLPLSVKIMRPAEDL